MCLTIAFDAICCAGSEICKCCCSCCKLCFKTGLQQQIRLTYIIINLLFITLGILTLYGLKGIFNYFSKWIHCPEASGGDLNCFGVSAIYRLSFILLVFYAFMLLSCLFRNQFSKQVNEGFWTLKIMVLVGAFIGFFFIDNSFFSGYHSFAQIFGGVYLIVQSVMLIDIFYMWGQKWVAKYDEGYENYKYILIVTAFLLYAMSITLSILNFIWFEPCGLNMFINILNLFLIIGITVVQLLHLNPSGSLITTGSQSLYITFLTFSAQLSGPYCNNLVNNRGALIFELSIGFFFIIVVLLYLSLATKQNSSKQMKTGNNDANVNSNILIDEKIEQDEDDYDDLKDSEKNIKQKKENEGNYAQLNQKQGEEELEQKILQPYKTNTYIIFHFIMLVLSVYIVMLLTNWGDPSFDSAIDFNLFQRNATSYWIKLIISWGSSLLYIWTLIAPALFPDRDFS